MQLKVTKATKSALITDTGFGAYDVCINPYVGCQFGCTYCYVRFFVKDEERPWGEFVRTRDHIKTKLPFELRKLAGKRLVIGTMTDPYQPQEQKAGLTRMVLEMIANSEHKPAAIGLFTRSPLVKRDIELLKKLGVRVHLTITPFAQDVLKLIEPIPVRTNARFELVKLLAANEIKTHISVSPVLPVFSDGFIDSFAKQISESGTKGFTVDPMQAYGESFNATEKACHAHPDWSKVAEIITDKDTYDEWKKGHQKAWVEAWEPYKHLPIRAIGMDHSKKTRVDLTTGEKIDFQEFAYPD